VTAIRVLVVDDSVVVRKLVTDSLSADPQIEVVGTAPNGKVALARVDEYGPDLVTMDIEMPVMDGIETVRALRKAGHKMPIIMFSTLTERGAAATLDALAAGASDYVTKPSNTGSLAASMSQVERELIPRVKALVGRRRAFTPVPAQAAARLVGRVPVRPEPAPASVRALLIGSSTGGPEALSRVFGDLGKPLPVPVLIVQHMPPVFTGQLAARLDRLGPTTVVEATRGQMIAPGHAYVAPGNYHMVLRRTAAGFATELNQDPLVSYTRPSVDVLFRSAVAVYAGAVLGVILTGMGSDGRTGCQDVISAGGTVYVQDEASSVVWGMPGAVAQAGLAHRVVPIADMAGTISRRLAARLAGGAAWR